MTKPKTITVKLKVQIPEEFRKYATKIAEDIEDALRDEAYSFVDNFLDPTSEYYKDYVKSLKGEDQ